jgi:hypothetical protein
MQPAATRKADPDRQLLMESLDAALEALRGAGKSEEVRLLADELDDIVRRVGAIVWQPRDVPDAPTGVAGTAGDGEVSLRWTAPVFDGGEAVTGYRITPYLNATAQKPVETGSSATAFTVKALANGSAYTFTVAAGNGIGFGADSAPTAVVVPAKPHPPT